MNKVVALIILLLGGVSIFVFGIYKPSVSYAKLSSESSVTMPRNEPADYFFDFFGIEPLNNVVLDQPIQPTASSASLKNDVQYVNVVEKGAVGDGKFDNWMILQRLADSLMNHGGGTLYFPNGNYAIYNKALVLWGSNITLRGESKENTMITKRGAIGYVGSCIDISGKVKGHKYFGGFGSGSYNRLIPYTGTTRQAENIRLDKLTINTRLDSKTSPKTRYANNLSIVNSKDVFVTNCVFTNAIQTNVVVVNQTDRFKNGTIRFFNCKFTNSGRHNVRVISYNQGKKEGNHVRFETCIFENVLAADNEVKELKGKRVLLWYRGAITNGASDVIVTNCTFDESGLIYVNGNANGFKLLNSEIAGKVEIAHFPNYGVTPSIEISNNTFGASRNQSKLVPVNNRTIMRKQEEVTQRVKIYPPVILKSEKVKIENK